MATIAWYFHSLNTNFHGYHLWFMVFNATFNNISVISWLSILLVEGTSVPEEIDMPQVTDKLNNILYQVNSRHRNETCSHQDIAETLLIWH
jgi:hypothetical protein